jgi:hypothetical protein
MVKVNISFGDLCDRIVILRTKTEMTGRIFDEIDEYQDAINGYLELHCLSDERIEEYYEVYSRLFDVHKLLWELEDDVREAHMDMDTTAVLCCSRLICGLNSTRANLKKKINDLVGDRSEPKTY